MTSSQACGASRLVAHRLGSVLVVPIIQAAGRSPAVCLLGDPEGRGVRTCTSFGGWCAGHGAQQAGPACLLGSIFSYG
jgi:hypothetical protein